jgi:hypothetical protein
MRIRRLVFVLLALVMLGVAPLAGCGGDDSASPVPLDAGADAAKAGAATDAAKDAQGDSKDAAGG